MATKLEDQEKLKETTNSVLMGTEEILGRTEADHRSQGKKDEVLTSSHEGQVLFNFCNLIEYQISHEFQIYEIHVKIGISHAFHIHEI